MLLLLFFLFLGFNFIFIPPKISSNGCVVNGDLYQTCTANCAQGGGPCFQACAYKGVGEIAQNIFAACGIHIVIGLVSIIILFFIARLAIRKIKFKKKEELK